jgi:glycosyltransferase involved in cell wall biosynthesis
MKIVMLGENISVHIQKWIRAVAAHNNVDLHVITFNQGVQYADVKYHYMKKYTGTRLDFFLNAFKVKSYIREINPDLVHAHYATSYGFLGAFSGFRPYIITAWGADIFDSPDSSIMNKILHYSYKRTDAVAVNSLFSQKYLAQYTGKFVHEIPFGVDIKKFVPSPYKSNDKIRIGTIRTLSEKYGVEYLIRAFALVSEKHSNLQLDIVGDGPLKEFLQNLTVELAVSDKVVFYGYVNQNAEFDKYISLLSNFDVFAILSVLDSETFGVAAVEASACAIPVIATNVGGLPEVIDNESSGILVPSRDVAATAQALQRLVENEHLRLQMGKNGREKVGRKYDWEKNVQQMMDLYEQVSKIKSK